MRTVAVIGASLNRKKFGNKAVRAFLRQGYKVVPVHPYHHEIEGLQAYPSVLDVPGSIDVVTIYVPPSVGVKVVEESAKKGVSELWLNPGADSPEVLKRARELGLEPIVACSVLAIGESPSDYN